MSSTSVEGERIASFYAHKNVLITGVTGFLGKMLLHKLIVACPDIGTIYLMARQKKDKSVKERIDIMLENVIFDKLKQTVPNYKEKICVIMGDMCYEGLGLIPKDRKLLTEKVNIVFHAAASVNFNEDIKLAVNTTVRGTRELITFCKEIKNLSCMMYVSTAYSFCPKNVIRETFYEPPVDPDVMIRLVNEMDVDVLKNITPQLIAKWPNTYTYAKAIAEKYIDCCSKIMPVGLFRPSIVVATHEEPVRGWIDNLNGPVGIIVVAGTGLLHVMHAPKSTVVDTVPVDYCINGLIASAVDVVKQHEMKVENKKIVYNYVASKNSSVSLGYFTYIGQKYYKNKFSIVMSPTFVIFTTCTFWYAILSFLLHYIPALLTDGALICTNQKPRMIKSIRKINKMINLLNFFLQNSWEIMNDNVQDLWNKQSFEDKKLFPFNMDNVDWEKSLSYYSNGVKQYILKDDMRPECIAKANEHYNRVMKQYKIYGSTFISTILLATLYFCPGVLTTALMCLVPFIFMLFISYYNKNFSFQLKQK